MSHSTSHSIVTEVTRSHNILSLMSQEEALNTKFALEQKIQELESRSSSSSSSYSSDSTPSTGQLQQTAAQQQVQLQQEEQRQLAQQELQRQLEQQQQQLADVQKQNGELLASRCATCGRRVLCMNGVPVLGWSVIGCLMCLVPVAAWKVLPQHQLDAVLQSGWTGFYMVDLIDGPEGVCRLHANLSAHHPFSVARLMSILTEAFAIRSALEAFNRSSSTSWPHLSMPFSLTAGHVGVGRTIMTGTRTVLQHPAQ